MATKACEVCGKPFNYRPSQEQERKTCSRSCGGTLRQRDRKAAGTFVMPVKPRRGAMSPCPVCGKDVYRAPIDTARGTRQFCSKACADVAHTKTPVIKNCATCGKELVLKPSQAAIQYCSQACKGVGITKRPMDRMHNGKAARKDRNGYVMVYEPDHPNKSFHGWQYEHRLVAERMLERYLDSSEHVHHINGIKDDNSPSNLAVMDGLEHAVLSSRDYRASVARQIAELAEYKQRYGPLEEN